MNRTVLQIPINAGLRKAAEIEAKAQGFSSLQEAVRVFLKKLADRAIGLKFEEPTIQLSQKAIKRYDKILEEIEKGKVKTKSFENVDSLMEYLHK